MASEVCTQASRRVGRLWRDSHFHLQNTLILLFSKFAHVAMEIKSVQSLLSSTKLIFMFFR